MRLAPTKVSLINFLTGRPKRRMDGETGWRRFVALILMADDDELVVEVVRAALGARGHIVGALNDGTSVKQVVELKRPDLVILDCAMPETTGVQALREIRMSDSGFATPVLMLTARTSQADEDIAFRAGADDYLRKPFDPDQLVARVERLLDRKPTRA